MTQPARLSDKELVVLQLLGSSEQYGLELVHASQGALKRGTVYVTLARMEEKGLVLVRRPPAGKHEAGLPRPRYRASALGQRLLAATEQWLLQFEGGRTA